MEHAPPDLLSWLTEHFKGVRAPDYEKAVRDLKRKTKLSVEADTLRHVACGYKHPGGLLAAWIETWTKGEVSAAKLLTWPHYSRDRASAA